MIKSLFTRKLGQSGVCLPMRSNGERRLWARRFWEHTIRDEIDLRRHIDYIHFNPVKHGWVEQAVEWPHSSLRRLNQQTE